MTKHNVFARNLLAAALMAVVPFFTVSRAAAADLPVGTIVASMLEEPQFQKASGKDWVLADGRTVTGTKYAGVTGKTAIPDLRGMFLRGENGARADGNQNPQAKLLGDYQEDAFKRHSHTVTQPRGVDGNRSGQQDAFYGAQTSSTGVTGGDETRPRNVTINYFIKIN